MVDSDVVIQKYPVKSWDSTTLAGWFTHLSSGVPAQDVESIGSDKWDEQVLLKRSRLFP